MKVLKIPLKLAGLALLTVGCQEKTEAFTSRGGSGTLQGPEQVAQRVFVSNVPALGSEAQNFEEGLRVPIKAFKPEILDDVPPSLKKLLSLELKMFSAFLKSSQQVYFFESSTNNGLEDWVAQRMKFFTSNENEMQQSRRILSPTWPYQQNIEEQQVFGAGPVGENSVIASNVGAALYRSQKMLSEVWELKLNDDHWVLLDSPRVGIIEIGRGFFSWARLINQNNTKAQSNSIARWTLLMHEARHSDGNAAHLGFAHSTCPAGHDYEFLLACDAHSNAASGIAADFLKKAMRECAHCEIDELEALKLLLLDSANRILSDEPASAQAEAPEYSGYQTK